MRALYYQYKVRFWNGKPRLYGGGKHSSRNEGDVMLWGWRERVNKKEEEEEKNEKKLSRWACNLNLINTKKTKGTKAKKSIRGLIQSKELTSPSSFQWTIWKGHKYDNEPRDIKVEIMAKKKKERESQFIKWWKTDINQDQRELKRNK